MLINRRFAVFNWQQKSINNIIDIIIQVEVMYEDNDWISVEEFA